jgi:hypothetical protein
MSRSSDLKSNPSVKTLQWKNEKKAKGKVVRTTGWYYWDKTANDGEGENVLMEMPLTFMWLESAQSFTGFHDKKEKGIYSNEILNNQDAVKKYGKKELVVKCDGETLVEGFYADIKEEAKGFGAKFCIPVYASMDIDGEYQIVRLLMTGSSGSAWMNFFKGQNTTKDVVISCYDKREVEMKTGATYDEPVFKTLKASKEQMEVADRLTVEVDEFFDYILSTNVEEEVVHRKPTKSENNDDLGDDEDLEKLPF